MISFVLLALLRSAPHLHSSELTPDDFELMPLEAINEDNGMLIASGRLKKGDRFKMMIQVMSTQSFRVSLFEHRGASPKTVPSSEASQEPPQLC